MEKLSPAIPLSRPQRWIFCGNQIPTFRPSTKAERLFHPEHQCACMQSRDSSRQVPHNFLKAESFIHGNLTALSYSPPPVGANLLRDFPHRRFSVPTL